jgi:3-dehydroquinate dehydratase I
MKKQPRICAVVTRPDLKAAQAVAEMVELYEVRLDIIGAPWQRLVKGLPKPWIATNRLPAEGGLCTTGEVERQEELMKAVELGAWAVDIELSTPNPTHLLESIHKTALRIISYHNLTDTPTTDTLRRIVGEELALGADICKVVTTARGFADNLALLRLQSDFAEARLVAFAMGADGETSRVLSPLMGGEFAYAALAKGQESAPGQPTVAELTDLYRLMGRI